MVRTNSRGTQTSPVATTTLTALSKGTKVVSDRWQPHPPSNKMRTEKGPELRRQCDTSGPSPHRVGVTSQSSLSFFFFALDRKPHPISTIPRPIPSA